MGLEFEEYKEIFPWYYISNFGNIKHDNNFLKKCIHSNGYEQVNIRIGNKYVTKLIHRLVAVAFIPNPEKLATLESWERKVDAIVAKITDKQMRLF